MKIADFNGFYDFNGYSASGGRVCELYFYADITINVSLGSTSNSHSPMCSFELRFDGAFVNGDNNTIGGVQLSWDHCLYLTSLKAFRRSTMRSLKTAFYECKSCGQQCS
ncbi:MAG: hypothetical protein IPN26_10690 [Bacteroidetes bacterium]|nr:hypothetical protein [Bacteroidota bacterium]